MSGEMREKQAGPLFRLLVHYAWACLPTPIPARLMTRIHRTAIVCRRIRTTGSC